MAKTTFSDVSAQVQTFWSSLFMKELRQNNLLVNLLDKSYSGELKDGGDTVKVSQIDAPTGSLLTVGTDSDTFESESLSEQQVSIKADKVAIASYEFESDALLLSQIGQQDSEIRKALLHAVNKKINTYLYSLIVPSTSSPDHAIVTTDFAAAVLSAGRKLAAQAKWPSEEPWYLLADPSYYSDMLDDTTLASADYGADDAPVIGGQMARQRFGFNIFEDNSLATDIAYAFYKDVVHLVMPQEAKWEVSSLHSQNKRGMLLSVEVVFGAKLGIDGASKCIKWTAS